MIYWLRYVAHTRYVCWFGVDCPFALFVAVDYAFAVVALLRLDCYALRVGRLLRCYVYVLDARLALPFRLRCLARCSVYPLLITRLFVVPVPGYCTHGYVTRLFRLRFVYRLLRLRCV